MPYIGTTRATLTKKQAGVVAGLEMRTKATPNLKMTERHPQIVACGHKHILAKTGNSFPAFLVQFPSVDTCVDGSVKYCYFWRSKRDFLLVSLLFEIIPASGI